MEEKHYIPKIEEFYVGFEYEYRRAGELWDDGSAEHEVMCDLKVDPIETIERDIKNEQIRVKYLDREDIESFGFKKSVKENWVGWEDYYLDDINGEYGYYLTATLHIPRSSDWPYKIIVHRQYYPDEIIRHDWIIEGESKVVYEGTINNKSEFKKLLQMLTIFS